MDSLISTINFSDPDLLSVFESDGWQMMQQGRGDLRAKPADGKIITRRAAAKTKQGRARRGTKGTSTIVTPAPKMDTRSTAQRKADHFAKKAAGLAKVKKGYIQRPTSGAQARRRLALPAASSPAPSKGKGKSKKSSGGYVGLNAQKRRAAKAAREAKNPFDASMI